MVGEGCLEYDSAHAGLAALIRILELSHEALTTGVITTKRFLLHPPVLIRILSSFSILSSPLTSSPFILHSFIQLTHSCPRDMYYRDPELFVKQAVVDRYVDDIAYTLGVERDALNVVSATFPRCLLFLTSIGMLGCCSQRADCGIVYCHKK